VIYGATQLYSKSFIHNHNPDHWCIKTGRKTPSLNNEQLAKAEKRELTKLTRYASVMWQTHETEQFAGDRMAVFAVNEAGVTRIIL
jgi:hypothetical protein